MSVFGSWRSDFFKLKLIDLFVVSEQQQQQQQTTKKEIQSINKFRLTFQVHLNETHAGFQNVYTCRQRKLKCFIKLCSS